MTAAFVSQPAALFDAQLDAKRGEGSLNLALGKVLALSSPCPGIARRLAVAAGAARAAETGLYHGVQKAERSGKIIVLRTQGPAR